MGKTKIEWTDETWNFSGGCKPVSAGCLNCAAARVASGRLKNHPLYKRLTKNGKWTGEIRTCLDIGRPDILEKPLHWRDSRMVFPCFMGDLFNLPFEFILKIFGLSMVTPWHTYQILTKRIDRALSFFEWWEKKWEKSRILWGKDALALQAVDGLPINLEKANQYWLDNFDQSKRGKLDYPIPCPQPNIWLGVSVENQKAADERIPILLQIPAAVRFVSVEPMLEAIDIKKHLWLRQKCVGKKGCGFTGASYEFDNPNKEGAYKCPQCGKNHTYLVTDSIDQVIIGCESGPKRRPCKLAWVRDLVGQCKAAGVLVFVKQIPIVVGGGVSTSSKLGQPGHEGKVWTKYKVSHDMPEWPEWAKLRQYPK